MHDGFLLDKRWAIDLDDMCKLRYRAVFDLRIFVMYTVCRRILRLNYRNRELHSVRSRNLLDKHGSTHFDVMRELCFWDVFFSVRFVNLFELCCWIFFNQHGNRQLHSVRGWNIFIKHRSDVFDNVYKL